MTLTTAPFPCPLCGGTDFVRVLSDVPDLFFQTGGSAHIERCAGCGLVQTRPRLTEEALESFYNEGYTEFLARYDPDEGGARWWNNYRLKVIDKVRKVGPQHKLLDVGCNQGQFVRHAAEMRGCEATGMDVNTAALQRGAVAAGVDYVTGTPGQADGMEGRRYQVVTAYQVLEHIPDPIGFLRATREYLDEDGLLVIEVPDFGAAWRPLFGRLWASLMVPQHLLHWERDSLRRAILEAGYAEIMYHQPMFVPISFIGSLGLVLRERFGIAPESKLARILLAFAWLLIDVPAELFLRAFHRTWVQVLIARKGRDRAIP